MKLYNQLYDRMNKPHIEPKWGSMDPDDYPNPLSPDPKPRNQTEKYYYAPDKEIKLNGYSMTPMVTGRNPKMAREFAELVRDFISKHAGDVNFSNALPEELKR